MCTSVRRVNVSLWGCIITLWMFWQQFSKPYQVPKGREKKRLNFINCLINSNKRNSEGQKKEGNESSTTASIIYLYYNLLTFSKSWKWDVFLGVPRFQIKTQSYLKILVLYEFLPSKCTFQNKHVLKFQ